MSGSVEKQIIEVEEKLRKAMLSSNIDALDKLLSPNLIFTNHFGLVISKSDDLEAHKKGDFKINSLTISEQIIRLSGPVAIVSTHAHISGIYKGTPTSGNFRFTRVWQKETAVWQVTAGHSNMIA